MTTDDARTLRWTDWTIPLLVVAFHLAFARDYGWFRDELYYVASTDHLDWGYVDHPPLSILVAWLVRAVAGDSLIAFRAVSAVAGGGTVLLVGSLARRFGGDRFAVWLAQVAAAMAPVLVALSTIYSMNALDLLCWAALVWLAADPLAGGSPRRWLLVGLIAGVGLQVKISMLFFGFGLAVGLVLARRWEHLRSPWLWAGGALAAVLGAPYAIWNAVHGWPTAEFIRNAREYKIVALSPLDFLAAQVGAMGAWTLPIWLVGLGALLAAGALRPWRPFGVAWLAVLGLMLVGASKPYYLAPAYAPLFAAGGVVWAGWLAGRTVLRGIALAVMLLAGGHVLPLVKPILPVERLIAYQAALGHEPSTEEHHELGRLSQFFADMHGWPELTAEVAEVHRALPPADREVACVFGQNYGQAGAIDVLGRRLGLPPAISGHNSYWLWGPGECTGDVMIVIGGDPGDLYEGFESVEDAGFFDCADCMPYEDEQTIWVVRGARRPAEELWPGVRHYD